MTDESKLGVTVQLCIRARRGDQQALAELYERHFGRVRRSAALRMGRRLKQCEQDIDDVVHDAFADVLRRLQEGELEGLETDGAFRNYLATVVLNEIRAKARRADTQKRGQGRERLWTDSSDSSMSELCQATNIPRPSEVARVREIEEHVEAAMLRLSDRYRRVLDLVYHCGMTPAEIAAAGLLDGESKPEAIRLILFRARQQLHESARDLLDE